MSGSKVALFVRLLLLCSFICAFVVCSTHVICLLEINSIARLYSVIGVRKWIPKSWSRNRYNTIVNLLLKECMVYNFQDGLISLSIGIVRSTTQLFLALLREILIVSLSIMVFPSLKGFWIVYRPSWIQSLEDRFNLITTTDSGPPDLVSCADYDNTEIIHDSNDSNSRHNQPPTNERVLASSRHPKISVETEDKNTKDSVENICLSPHKISQHVAENWHVFDPVYGVIQKNILDKWNKSEAETEAFRQKSLSTRNAKKIPPVRFSQQTSTRNKHDNIPAT